MNKTALAVSAALVSGLALVAILVAAHVMKAEPLDQMGCGSNIAGKTVILLDTSDDVTSQTRNEIVKRIWNVIDQRVRDGDLVSIFTVSDLSKRNLVPAFSYCKPRRRGNEFKENIRTLDRNYLNKFKKPINELVTAPMGGSKESPIAQSLIDISLSDSLRVSNGSANLLVFSDLMENTNTFSLYRCGSGNQAVNDFKESRSAAVARPTFKDVTVELHIIPRADTSSSMGHCRDHFWGWFFGDNEGSSASVVPFNLPG